MTGTKRLLRSLKGETLDHPPIWMMRQAGRYLPEYREVRKKAGGFLDLCYNPDLATEVTLQPIRRFGFDASILFADILLLPQALGMDVWFESGEGPRLAKPDTMSDFGDLRPTAEIHETLSPIYQTVRNLSQELPRDVTLIGFAGAPWTVATYMIAGRGTPDQAPARRFIYEHREEFDGLIDRLTEATIEYLSAQVDAGAEVIQLFDSWAGSLPDPAFQAYSLKPLVRIAENLKARHPGIPVIVFPRGAGERYAEFTKHDCFDGISLDTTVSTKWASEAIQPHLCVQGNLDPMLLEIGGDMLEQEVGRIRADLSGGAHVFNLGHGITIDGQIDNVHKLIELVRK